MGRLYPIAPIGIKKNKIKKKMLRNFDFGVF